MAGHTHVNTDGTGTWPTPEDLRRHLAVVHGCAGVSWTWDELPSLHSAVHLAATLGPRRPGVVGP